MEAAQALRATAESEVKQYESDVQEFETQLVQMPAAVLVPTGRPMKQIQHLLCGRLEQLRNDPYEPANQVSGATVHIQQLVLGFHATVDEAKKLNAAQADAAKIGPTTQRDGKQPPREPLAPPAGMVRHSGKLAAKRLITDQSSRRLRRRRTNTRALSKNPSSL